MKYIKVLFTILFITSFHFGVSAQDYKDSKVVEGSYNVSKGSTLKLQNQFTSVEIEEWNKNEVKFTADISVETSSKEATERLISAVNLRHSQKGDVVTLESGILGNGGNNVNTKGKTSFNIKLKIYAPKGLKYDAAIKFGNFKVPYLGNDSKAEVQFGNLTVNEVKPGSKISVKFGGLLVNKIEEASVDLEFASDKSVIKSISGDANINIRYSNAAIELNDITSGSISVAFSKVYFVTNNKLNAGLNIVSRFGSVNNKTSLKLDQLEKDKYSQTIEYNYESGNAKKIKIKPEFSTIYFDNVHPADSFFKGKNKTKGVVNFSTTDISRDIHEAFASVDMTAEIEKAKIAAEKIKVEMKTLFAEDGEVMMQLRKSMEELKRVANQ